MTGFFRASPGLGVVALYDEAPGGGDPRDINSLRHRPLVSPENWLAYLRWHSSLDQMEVSHGPTIVPIAHASVAAAPGSGTAVNLSRDINYTNVSASHTLVTHSLGYVPDFMVIYEDNVLYPGQIVQFETDGRCRQVSPYATTSIIGLREWAVQTGNAIASISRSYTVVVFRQPPEPVGNALIKAGASVGAVEMAMGRFRSDRRYLQVTPVGSPYGFSLGQSIDLDNGAPRYVAPDGDYVEPIPSDYGMRISFINQPGGAIGGGPMHYQGSFTGSGAVLVSVP